MRNPKITGVLLTRGKPALCTSKLGMITCGKYIQCQYLNILHMKNYSVCFIIQFLIAYFSF